MLTHLNTQFEPQATAKKGPTLDVWESLNLDIFMSPEAITKRKATEACMKKNVDAFIPYFNKEEMPTFIIP